MRVVIVDDHPLVRKGLIAVLANEEEIEVVGVSESVEDGMQVIEETKPDLAIVDIRLGERTGFELVESFGHSGCRFIMLTSSAAEFDVRRAEESGADGYVLKDSMPEELLLAIKMVDRGRKYFDQGLMEVLIRKEADDPLEKLTPKEREVLISLGEGLSNGSMAKKLMISEFTVKKHVSRIFQKLNLNDRTQAALYAQSRGMAAYSPPDDREEENLGATVTKM
ncbi:response regulator [Paenibacillus sacheonensis]|uniref:Response regulator n=1 Tax=Paenibacillus sacheonensis TaxID=742054 RepID=A0A7X5BY14_9BACL|nr:response regulator transcription factor [Paenibacillus sacheonensis]MBM7563616.1 DNA-binding NarL/FixJ family response regulator [Paenibacillus sacheonensis]NBC71088.1 response regulator [Paenibacillus sacheonensis]